MTKIRPFSGSVRKRQWGVVAVEFAIIAMLFFSLLIGILEFSRVLFLMNAAVEATRLGARVAAVCDVGSPAVRSRMQELLGILDDGDITVTYEPASCTRENCEWVLVSVNRTINTMIPLVPVSIDLPTQQTRLPRESLDSVGGTNPVCN